MFVDILMCTYNGEKFIEQQIQSILDQTHTDFNLIIIDDVSSDGTVEIIKKMMLSDSRIELHQNAKNLGYFDNFLFGLNYVKSDYLFFSDQDDVWLSNKIEIQLNDLIHENEKVLMNFSNSYLWYDEEIDHANYSTKRDPKKIKTSYSSPIELALRNIVAGHTILIRTNQLPAIKERLSRIKNKKEIYFDYILTLVLLDLGEVKYINKPLVYFRQHLNSTSTKMRMNYYTYVSSNAHAFSQISSSAKSSSYFTSLHKVASNNTNFFNYLTFLRQNSVNSTTILNNYDFYNLEKKPSFFMQIYRCFKLSYSYYRQR